jgi:hypothetical protein
VIGPGFLMSNPWRLDATIRHPAAGSYISLRNIES